MSEPAASPAPNVEEVSVERAPDVDAPDVEPAEMTDAPQVQSCQSVESPVVEAASPELEVGAAAKDEVTSEREKKEMDYAATHNPKKATIDKIRGGVGPVFEAHAAVLRGNQKTSPFRLLMQCFQKERDFVTYSEVQRFVLIKAKYLFVFHDTSATSPLYAVPLSDLNASLEDPANPSDESYTISPTGESNEAGSGLETVLLRGATPDDTKKVLYQVTFSTKDASIPNAASQFVEIVNGDIVEVSKNSVLDPSKGSAAKKPPTQSVVYAHAVAESKMQHQPIEFSSA